MLIEDERAAYWRDLTGTHPYNPDPEEAAVRAGGLVEDKDENIESSRSGGEYKEQMRESQLTKKERDNALATMWAISVVAYSCCQPAGNQQIVVFCCRLLLY